MNIKEKRMKRKTAKTIGWVLGVLGAALIILAACALSWIVTCGIIKAITMCFGWTFSWAVATGVWLIICLVRTTLNHTITVKK